MAEVGGEGKEYQPAPRVCKVHRVQVTALVEALSRQGVVDVVKGVLQAVPGFDIVEVRSLD